MWRAQSHSILTCENDKVLAGNLGTKLPNANLLSTWIMLPKRPEEIAGPQSREPLGGTQREA